MTFEFKRLIAKGGMGEVFLAYDPFVQRDVAIKKIRSDLKENKVMKERFLREAKITAQLTHPGVITIYSIHQENNEIYYTMPFVEGKTLKEILRTAPYPSVGFLLPIFKSICQTIAYAHSKKIIHRDIKPENILIGNFGEVIILDWGLAQFINESKEDVQEEETVEEEGLTIRGKIVGTLAYMAPERALGVSASFQSDIYSLGVVLYQLLTLKIPYQRTSVKELRKNYHLETLVDPEEMAPYRDVPPRLSHMVKKCLSVDLTKRYTTVEELIEELSSHMEGRAEWLESKQLHIEKEKDWEFKENILFRKHSAIAPEISSTDWVSVMISKASFAENTRLETHVTIHEQGQGIGFLLNVPESEERKHPLDGYCIWLDANQNLDSQIYKNQTLTAQIPDLFLKKGTQHKIVIEKVDNKIQIFLDDVPKFTYISYLPLLGTHVGLFYKDFNFSINPISVLLSSPTLQLSCISVPDAFLAVKDYKRAIPEYRRIGYTFPGHAEGREALFKSGITFVELGKNARSEKKKIEYFTRALEEFAKLHVTPGAPLEYLGKSIVYDALEDHAEEIRCLEFALRRYKSHPLIHVIEEQILFRMQESAQNDRWTAYALMLTSLRLLPETSTTFENSRLFKNMVAYLEKPYFIQKEAISKFTISLMLAFWLANTHALEELEKENPTEEIEFAKMELSHFEKLPTKKDFKSTVYLMEHALFKTENTSEVHYIAKTATALSKEEEIIIDALDAWAFLLENNRTEAEKIFAKYDYELLNHETTWLYTVYGCYLALTEGEEIAFAHFAGVTDVPFPRTYALLGHQIANKILEKPSWLRTSFMWERRQLYRQLTLYYHCLNDLELKDYYKNLENKEYLPT